MNKSFIEYCESIGMGATLREQVGQLLSQCQSLLDGQQIQDIFVSEYVDKDGGRQYDTLYCFSGTVGFEIEKFISDPRIWIISDKAAYLSISKAEFDFVTSTDASRLNIGADWAGTSFSFNMRASGKNCEHLMSVVRKYILPYVMKV